MRRYIFPISLALLVSMLMIAIVFIPDYFVKKDLSATSNLNDKDSLQLFYYYQHVTDSYKMDTAWNQNAINIQKAHQIWLDSLYSKEIVIASGSALVSTNDPRHFDMAIIIAPDIRFASEVITKDPRLIYGTHIGELVPFSFNHIGTKKMDQLLNSIVL